jgi:hypothetical protein
MLRPLVSPACRTRPSSNSSALLRLYRAYTQCLASAVRTCPLDIPGSDCFILASACLAEPLVLGSSGWFAAGLASRAGPRWFCACSHPSVRNRAHLSSRTAGSWLVLWLRRWSCFAGWSPLVLRLLAPLGPSSCALVTLNRWFLARPVASPLVLLRRLVSSGSALARTPQSSGGMSAGLAPLSPPLTSSVPLLDLCAREFHWNSAALIQSHTRGCTVLTVPRVR